MTPLLHTYVIATKRGRRVCAGRAKNIVDLDLAVARTSPHEVGANGATDPPGEPEVGEHAPGEIATKYSSCDEQCGSNAERKAKKIYLFIGMYGIYNKNKNMSRNR